VTIQTDSKAPSPKSTAPTAGLSSDEQQALSQFMQLNGTTAGAGKVWMPSMASGKPQGARAPSARTFPGAWVSEDDADGLYFNWTQKQRDDFRAKGLLSGLLTQGAGDLEAYSLWQSLVKQASYYGAEGKGVGPLDILSSYVKNNSKGGFIRDGDFEVNPVTGERRYVGPKFKTTTQTNVDLTDPATARAIATSVFQSLLGRDPGQGEIASYAEALAQSERNHPSSVTTTTQYNTPTGEAVGSSSVTQGGMTDQGRQLLAEDKIKQDPEYGAVQAATTYMDALESAVGSGS
jgi:hypothetical protein